MTYNIWYGEDESAASYIAEIGGFKSSVGEMRRIEANRKRFAENPPSLREILYLDRPDLIITEGDPERPILGVEFCAESPSGHNIPQRLARVAAAAEFGIPFAFVFPERKWIRRGENHKGRWDEYNPFPLRALIQIGRFHAAPTLAFFWPADEQKGNPRQGYLVCDRKYPNLPGRRAPEIMQLANFVKLTLAMSQRHIPASQMVFDPLYIEREIWMWEKYHSKAKGNAIWSPLTSTSRIKTEPDLLEFIVRQTGLKPNLPGHILARSETVLYQPKTSKFRSDPYAGSLVGIDYHECRNGPTPQHRFRNLLINFSRISFAEAAKLFEKYHRDYCPMQKSRYSSDDRYLTIHLRDGCRYTKQKELRIFCFLADIVLFQDAILY